MADDQGACGRWHGGRNQRFGAAQFEATVRSRMVVVVQELLDHCLQVAAAEDQQVVEQLRRQVPTNLSAIEFARSARNGNFNTSTPSEPKPVGCQKSIRTQRRSRQTALPGAGAHRPSRFGGPPPDGAAGLVVPGGCPGRNRTASAQRSHRKQCRAGGHCRHPARPHGAR